MAIRIHYVEKGIVHIQWIDKINIDELDVGVREIRQKMDEEGSVAYVEIVDLLECTAIPFDLRGLRRIATFDPRIIGYVLLKPSELAKAMMNMLKQVTRLSFGVASSLDESIIAARLMLNERLTTKI